MTISPSGCQMVEVCSQAVDKKALLWSIIHKSACILAEITIWKSQLLSMTGRIACKDASRFEAFSCPWPPSSTFYKMLDYDTKLIDITGVPVYTVYLNHSTRDSYT